MENSTITFAQNKFTFEEKYLTTQQQFLSDSPYYNGLFIIVMICVWFVSVSVRVLIVQYLACHASLADRPINVHTLITEVSSCIILCKLFQPGRRAC